MRFDFEGIMSRWRADKMKIRLGIILSEAAYRKLQDNININEAFKELK